MHDWNVSRVMRQRGASTMDAVTLYRRAPRCQSETCVCGSQAQPNPQPNSLESGGFRGTTGDTPMVSGVFGELKSSLWEAVSGSADTRGEANSERRLRGDNGGPARCSRRAEAFRYKGFSGDATRVARVLRRCLQGSSDGFGGEDAQPNSTQLTGKRWPVVDVMWASGRAFAADWACHKGAEESSLRGWDVDDSPHAATTSRAQERRCERCRGATAADRYADRGEAFGMFAEYVVRTRQGRRNRAAAPGTSGANSLGRVGGLCGAPHRDGLATARRGRRVGTRWSSPARKVLVGVQRLRGEWPRRDRKEDSHGKRRCTRME
jgi:hypothetical protein